MPKKANGMHSNPRITMAIQPEVFSRSFCSIGQECRDEAGQFTRMAQAGPTRAACAEAASPSGDGGYSARTVCARASDRSEARRVGKEWVSTGRSRGSRLHKEKKHTKQK